MQKLTQAVLLLVVACAIPLEAVAQTGHLVPVEDPIYTVISRLQHRGLLLELNPTALPYTESAILKAVQSVDSSMLDASDDVFIKQIESRLYHGATRIGAVKSDTAEQPSVGIRLQPGIRATNNGRLDPVRYLGGSDYHVFENVLLQLRFSVGRFSSALGVRHDLYYDQDPDGLDSALRWLTRTKDSYLRYSAGYFEFVLGRFSRHWGIAGQPSTVVSDNPRSYDQIGFRIGGERLSVSAFLGELDSITGDGRFTGTAGDDSIRVGSERRYLAGHRLDWRPSPSFQLYFFQSILYSGSNAGLSLKYFNPFHSVIFALDTIPKNEENNGFVGFGFWYQRGSRSVNFQGTVDDVDVLNLKEPISFAVTGSATFARLPGGLDVTVGGHAVASRTYNTHQTEGKYLYLLRGLATQFSDYVAIFAQLDYHAVTFAEGLMISPRVDILFQGEADIRNAFPSKEMAFDSILNGTVERTLRGAVRVAYDPVPWVFFRVDAGLNATMHAGHVSGASASRFIAVAEFGLRLSLHHSFSVDFP